MANKSVKTTPRRRVRVNQQQEQQVQQAVETVGTLDTANVSDDEEGGTRIGDIYIPPPVAPYCSTESKGPRLIIKSIVNKNFKSYAGTVTLGPFHHSFTAIIGPNGSGKSNVIDSMLFVFGYRANKIRCKKISTLIHKSSLYPNISSCSVTVIFEQIIDGPTANECEIVPNSRLEIERVGHVDNSSYYAINKRRVNFKEVAKLLRKHNVDLDHNRFLILQGEVESIAMMKAKSQNDNDTGMLEYLEDIVGTTRYINPLQMINQRVEQLTEDRTEKHNRLKLSEREMKDLEEPYNIAVNYLKKENELTYNKNVRIQKCVSQLNHELEEASIKYEDAKSVLQNHDDEAQRLREQREEKEKIINAEAQEYDKLRKKKDKLQKNLDSLKSKDSEISQNMEVTNNRRHKNKKQIVTNTSEMEALLKIPQKNEKEIADCEHKIERLTKDKEKFDDELKANYAELEQETKPLVAKRDALETKLIDLNNNFAEAKSDLAVKEESLRMLLNDELTEKRQLDSFKAAYKDNEETHKEKSIKLKELINEIPIIKKTIATKQEELKNAEIEEEKIKGILSKLRSEINDNQRSLQAQRSNNDTLNFIMLKKKEGVLPGVYGRLGDLGAINSKYDVAISTCCGRLDNILVDNVDTATECLTLLREYNVGRGTFIALKQVDHWGSKSGKIKTPENTERLYDLIHVEDERVRPAFYFALRDTLVVNSLEQAARIAYGAERYRVVTLDGNIIDISGQMSGGGTWQIRGKMGTQIRTKTGLDVSLVSQKALQDMQERALELQTKVNYLQEQQGHLELEIQKLYKVLDTKEYEINSIQKAIKTLELQMPSGLKQIQRREKLLQEKKTDTVKVKQLEADIKRAKEIFGESQSAIDEINKHIDGVKKEIENIYGNKIKAVQTKIKNTENQIKKLGSNVSKLKVEITSTERKYQNLQIDNESIQKEIETAQEQMKSMMEQHKKYVDEMAELEQEIEDTQLRVSEAKSQSSSLHKEIQSIQKLENENQLKRIEIEQNVQNLLKALTEVRERIPQWKNKLKPLQLNEIPGETTPLEPLKTYTEEELEKYSLDNLQYKEILLEEDLAKKPNISCIAEYAEKRNVYLQRVKVLDDITSRRNEMRDKYEEVRKRRYSEFMDSFHIITRKLKEMYQMITQGGDAELELVDSMDPFTEGVAFSVRPPKKSWKNISNLSGGEKTLASLALVFALHYYKPSPLYFMDEIDAALDFKNVSIVGHYIKERTKNAQFIIVSLRANMFELSNYLVGIFKIRDCTDAICMKNDPKFLLMPEMEAALQEEEALQLTALQDGENPQQGELLHIGDIQHDEEAMEETENMEVDEGIQEEEEAIESQESNGINPSTSGITDFNEIQLGTPESSNPDEDFQNDEQES